MSLKTIGNDLRTTLHNQGSILRIIGLLVLCAGLSTIAAAAQTSEISANVETSEHWRGAYDILVRPNSAVSDPEKKTGLVEGNYLGIPYDGITLDQYNLIKTIPGIEVSAPVATVGYIHNSLGSINLDLIPETKMIYRIETKLIERGGEIDRHTAYISRLIASDPKPLNPSDDNTFFYGVMPLLIDPRDGTMASKVRDLPPLWTLISGIDPEEEAKLVKLNSVINGNEMPSDLRTEVEPGTSTKQTVVPLWVSQRSYLDLQVEMNIASAPISDNQTFLNLKIPAAIQTQSSNLQILEEYFNSLQSTSISKQTIKFDRAILPMKQAAITLRPGLEPVIGESGVFSKVGNDVYLYPGGRNYQTTTSLPNISHQQTFQIISQGTWGGRVQPAYEALIKSLHPNYSLTSVDVPKNAPLFQSLSPYSVPTVKYKIYGTYDFEQLGQIQDPLSYVPLGIYEPPVAILLYDSQGNPINPQLVTPDLNPAGVIGRPPLALTTLKGAQFLVGRDDFITAIRIRISGIDSYTPENVAKVEQVAGEIVERTGLNVDIVAGSSPQKVLVKAPGYGYIEEQWTTLGTALSITSGINVANISLFGCLLLCSVLFIVNASQVSLLGKRQEIALLRALGWQTNHLNYYLLRESLWLGLIAAVFAGLASLALTFSLGLIPNGWVIFGVTLGATALYLIASLPAINQAATQTPARILSVGEVFETDTTRISKELNIPLLAWKSLLRRKTRSMLSIMILGLGVALIYMVIGILSNLDGRLQLTLLGKSVVLHIRSYHSLMVITTLGMGALAALENLLLGVLVRRKNFAVLRAIGWKKSHLMFIVLWEGLILGGLGAIVGVIFGMPLLKFTTGAWIEQPTILISLLLGSILLGGVVAIYPALIATASSPIQYLSGSPRDSKGYSNYSMVKQAVIISSLILITVIFVGLLGGKPDQLQNTLRIGHAPQPTLHPIISEVSQHDVVEQINTLSGFENRNLGNLAEKQAAQSISQAFSSLGLNVTNQPVILSGLTLMDAKNQVVFQIPSQHVKIRGIAYQGQELAAEKDINGKLLFLPKGASFPLADELTGKIVLLEVDQNDIAGEELRQWIGHYPAKLPCLAVASIAFFSDREIILEQLQKGNFYAQMSIGKNLIATIPGKTHPNQEIWLVTHYDGPAGSPGADQGSSGPAALIEIARLMSNKNNPFTFRFILLTGSYSGYEGAVEFLRSQEIKNQQVRFVLEIDQLGNWDHLALSSVQSEQQSNLINIEKVQKEGQAFLRDIWMRRIDLGDSSSINLMNTFFDQPIGLSESPIDMRQTAQEVATMLTIPLQLYAFSPCDLTGHVFLFMRYPTLMVCGQGNGLAGTEYDTPQSLNTEKLQKSIGWINAFLEQMVTHLLP